MDREAAIDALLAKDEIRTLINHYAQAIDRCDPDKLATVFWPDARCEFGPFDGTAAEFAAGVMSVLRPMERTMHLTGNHDITVDGDSGAGEIYVIAYHEIPEEKGTVVRVSAGRYLDRYERRGGEWRIAARAFVLDWNQNAPTLSDWDAPFHAAIHLRGERIPNDPAYTRRAA